MSTLAQILLVISFFSFALYNYLDNLNDLTRLRLALPQIQQLLHEEAIEYHQLRDEWARMTSAQELYRLQNSDGWRHLREYRQPLTIPAAQQPNPQPAAPQPAAPQPNPQPGARTCDPATQARS